MDSRFQLRIGNYYNSYLGYISSPSTNFLCDISLRENGNKLLHYINHVEQKGDLYSHGKIYVEVNLEKGILESLEIDIDGWVLQQSLDYEHIPFKCTTFHAYRNFAKNCPKIQEDQPSSM
jgi:hypothetical protein